VLRFRLMVIVLFGVFLIAFIQFAPITLIQYVRDHLRIVFVLLLLPVVLSLALLKRWNKE